jgi:hypothetical protein
MERNHPPLLCNLMLWKSFETTQKIDNEVHALIRIKIHTIKNDSAVYLYKYIPKNHSLFEVVGDKKLSRTPCISPKIHMEYAKTRVRDKKIISVAKSNRTILN